MWQCQQAATLLFHINLTVKKNASQACPQASLIGSSFPVECPFSQMTLPYIKLTKIYPAQRPGEVGTGLGQARRDFIWTTRKEESGGRVRLGPIGQGNGCNSSRALCCTTGRPLCEGEGWQAKEEGSGRWTAENLSWQGG